MKLKIKTDSSMLVVGAGIMGAGIAQVAAQSGHPVQLFDTRAGAAEQAKAQLAKTLQGLVAKGRLSEEAVQNALARISPVTELSSASASSVGLVVEAIVENLEAKQALFKQLESVVSEHCILATNTSSISVTALAKGMQHPGRLVGMHFFNPVALMKLVEVVSGLHTDPAVAQAIFELSQAWGKTPVHARSTPGFIVNRIARPYYAETLALLHEQAAEPQVLDACLRAAGFRMGPCELMDLIGHDTNFAVTNSVYAANFFDKRYVPSLVQRDMVDGGLLGRKSGRGFYRYPEGAPPLAPAAWATLPTGAQPVVHGSGDTAQRWVDALSEHLGHAPEQRSDSTWQGLAVGESLLMLTDGRTATEVAATLGRSDVAVFDRSPMLAAVGQTPALAYAVARQADASWQGFAAAWLALLGCTPLQVADTPGLVVARTLAMLINEAADAVQQGVCSPAGADAAMKAGVAYPAGPFEFLKGWSVPGVVALLQALDDHYRGDRYRVSPWLRQRLHEPATKINPVMETPA